jgi:hypothetical protein
MVIAHLPNVRGALESAGAEEAAAAARHGERDWFRSSVRDRLADATQAKSRYRRDAILASSR